ncbi:hypothetical protein SERLA73DRAFT_145889 [Serpula lacrymans var. lacrymans S7.3]|uniref:Uncharacterized protein n=1 Tax=Serpula lacrymans var. lacrymans (strain S7.3) TaxID=936435 RepID=F8QER6_SERL3|nr:hypothetical protein SERLA73DRAFT_145889 [Serpula lacrymans var. lacrymans S7.3]
MQCLQVIPGKQDEDVKKINAEPSDLLIPSLEIPPARSDQTFCSPGYDIVPSPRLS